MGKTTNNQIANEITSEAYAEICNFFNEHLIHVPLFLHNNIKEKTKIILDKYFKSKYYCSSIENLTQKSKNTLKVSKVLLQYPNTKVWTIKELADISTVCKSNVHRIKERLSFLKIIEPSNLPNGKTKFRLADNGRLQLEKLFHNA